MLCITKVTTMKKTSNLFMLTKRGGTYQTKYYDGKAYPILTDELRREIREFVQTRLKHRIDKSIKDDKGTCVLGAGIQMPVFLNQKEKYPYNITLLETNFQGNVSIYRRLLPAIKFLKKYYPHLNTNYYDGRMD